MFGLAPALASRLPSLPHVEFAASRDAFSRTVIVVWRRSRCLCRTVAHMTTSHTMPDSEPCSRHACPGLLGVSTGFHPLLLAALVAALAAGATGCTSSLTAIALRDAMREIAEYGQHRDDRREDAADEAFADDGETEDLLSLEEALDSAVTRLAAVGRLDTEARQMLLETLESTNQTDWPIVIESFASSLEDHAKSQEAIDQIAEHLAAEAGEDETSPTEGALLTADGEAETVASVVDVADDEVDQVALETPAEEEAEEALAVASEEPREEAPLEMVGPLSVGGDETIVETEPVGDEPLENVAAVEPDPAGALEPVSPPALAAVATETAAPITESTLAEQSSPPATEPTPAESLAEVAEPSPAPTVAAKPNVAAAVAERVTTAIRELPVSEGAGLSPEETMRQLEAALAAARRQAPLRVDNPCFAWQVRAWGDVERCDVSRFCVGQQVIVYFEVDNLTADAGPDGHATKLDTELRLVNVSGECLHEWSFPPLAECCPAPRRDYFARYILEVPSDVAPGPLRLEMTVRDLVGGKSTDVALPLEVVDVPAEPGERVASDGSLLR